jgi:hypothetical protein
MRLLLCAAWIVLYAGLIFLGFGGCRWTSDMTINYYRTVLGVGVSLMTMQLIIRIGVEFFQQLFVTKFAPPQSTAFEFLPQSFDLLAASPLGTLTSPISLMPTQHQKDAPPARCVALTDTPESPQRKKRLPVISGSPNTNSMCFPDLVRVKYGWKYAAFARGSGLVDSSQSS